MIPDIIYAAVVLFADIIGAFSGLGGGMIIKPAMGILHKLPLNAIVLYSSIAVFIMSIVSVSETGYNMHKRNQTLNWKAILCFGFGGILGGILGDIILRFSLRYLSSILVNNIQVILMAAILIGAIWFQITQKILSKLRSVISDIIMGLLLGTIAAILGIGGGPLNVWWLMMFIDYPLKEATTYSLAIVFFSTGSHLVTALIKGEFAILNWQIILSIVPAAIIGGTLGTIIKKKMNPSLMRKLYIWMLVGILILNICNLQHS